MDTMKTFHLFENYHLLEKSCDEYFQRTGEPHSHVIKAIALLSKIGVIDLQEQQRLSEILFRKWGVTFNVYHHSDGTEKIFPFDSIPRIISSNDWDIIERGVIQRVKAINLFLCDFYGKQQIFKDKIVPEETFLTTKGYNPKLHGIIPIGGTYVHVAGIDLIRTPNGEFCVLEDNLRTPSGVSYVLQNRLMMKNLYPSLFETESVKCVDTYPLMLGTALASLKEKDPKDVYGVLLTPGPFNAAYYEHLFLAKELGYDLVRGQDLYVENDYVYSKTIRGPKLVDVIYRRIDEEFLDPEFFNHDSLLGVPGLMNAYIKKNVVLANAPGNGVIDDKASYVYIPDMIRYYLNEEPLLKQIDTYVCSIEDQRKYVLDNIQNLVIKRVDASGGYGMLLGPFSTKAQQEEFTALINRNPRGYIAQPLIDLSTCPTIEGSGLTAKRIDLRPYIITGTSTWVLPGGLTRVALETDSYVVNSSQGGGSKDTWVLSRGESR